jgi:hypothetical protein
VKKIVFVTLIPILALTSGSLQAQESCQVLLPAISGAYAGDCKQGLAHGVGEATGVDFYRGEFVKGLPQGKGTYIWKNGASYSGDWEKGLRHGEGVYTSKHEGRDSVLAGIWKEDKYIGRKASEPYVIEYRNGIGRVTCMRIGDRPYIKYKFSRNGGESNIMSNLLLQGSSGTESNTAAFTGYEEVKFPFSGKVIFNAPNAFNSATLSCELRLKINRPGSWLVTISF